MGTGREIKVRDFLSLFFGFLKVLIHSWECMLNENFALILQGALLLLRQLFRSRPQSQPFHDGPVWQEQRLLSRRNQHSLTVVDFLQPCTHRCWLNRLRKRENKRNAT